MDKLDARGSWPVFQGKGVHRKASKQPQLHKSIWVCELHFIFREPRMWIVKLRSGELFACIVTCMYVQYYINFLRCDLTLRTLLSSRQRTIPTTTYMVYFCCSAVEMNAILRGIQFRQRSTSPSNVAVRENPTYSLLEKNFPFCSKQEKFLFLQDLQQLERLPWMTSRSLLESTNIFLLYGSVS